MPLYEVTLAILLVSAVASAQSLTAIPGVINAGTQPELVQEGFTFTEGPIPAPGGGIFFTDVRTFKLYRLDAAGKVTTIREASTGANGLAYNKAGDLYAAEGTRVNGSAAQIRPGSRSQYWIKSMATLWTRPMI